jgi:hypothetical protein
MDEALKERLIRYLDSVEGKVDKAIDFTAEQTPLYVQELCQYGAMKHGMCVAAALLLSVALFIAWCITMWACRVEEKPADRWVVRSLFSALFALVALAPFFTLESHAPELYKCVYCPRVYIVEQISEMVK